MATVLLAVALAGGCQGQGGGGDESAKVVKLAFVTNNTSEFWKIAGERHPQVRARGQGPGRHQDAAQRQDRGAEPDPREPGQPGLRRHRGQRDRAQGPGPGPEQRRPRRPGSSPSTPTRPQSKRLLYVGTINYEAGKKLGERIVQLLPKGGKMAVFVGFFSADNAAQRLQGHLGRHRGPRHRDRREARGPDRPREGALQRRGHPERPPRREPGVRPVVLQRARDRGGARGHGQAEQGAGRGLRRGRRHPEGHPRRDDRGHRGAAPLRDGLSLRQVDAPPGHRLRQGPRRRSRRTASRTPASRSSTRTTSDDFEKRLAEWKK